jgi:hypothetical protein
VPTKALINYRRKTVKIENWSGDIAEIGAIYPSGSEFTLVLIGFVLWIAWFLVQARMENREYEEEILRGKPSDVVNDEQS